MKRAGYVILWFLVLLSLILHVVYLAGLWTAQRIIRQTVDEAIVTAGDLQNEVFETTVHVVQSVPVSVDLPFRREMRLPVDVTIPISDSISFDRTIEVAVDTPLGTQSIAVPISATIPVRLSVPVRTEVPVAISETIPINTDVALDLRVPVTIQISETPLRGYLEKAAAMLAAIRHQLTLGR